MENKFDYDKIGLKSGIEIHAQLEGKKLFCNCPTIIREDKPDFRIKRKLKAVVGETGEIDSAASGEQDKNKNFVYEGYDDTTCLVEIDEEPPHLMNKGCLNLALQTCLHLKCKIVDEVQIMRKTVIDGSNTTGFQRTSLVGYNGKLNVNGNEIKIDSVAIEEDACKIVKRNVNEDVYNLSRLGIPLIEIATGPNMHTPKEVVEVAEKIGMYLRSLSPFDGQSIKRGLGTIRQDVNVSIKGGERIEIKGAQDLKLIPTLIDNEISRQIKLLEIKKSLKEKKIKLVENEKVELNNVFSETKSDFIKKKIESGDSVFGIKVFGFKGIFKQETMPGRRIGSEISDYAKKAGVGGIIHSDENLLEKYNFNEKEINSINSNLKISKNDAFILVVDKKETAIKAIEYAINRIKLLFEGVIKEVRKANADGTTTYMRPMPGGARMYPETDTLPLVPNLENVQLGKTINEKVDEYVEKGVKNKDVALNVAKNYSDIFESLLPKYDANFLASNIVSGASVGLPKIEILDKVFSALYKGKVPKNSYLDILELIKSGKDVESVIKSKESMSKEDLEKIVDEIISKNKNVTLKDMGKLMGQIMGASKGKADGKMVSDILKDKLK